MKASFLELGTKVPDLVCIEMPCFVRNQQEALAMLGGNDQVERSFQMDDSAPIQCRLPGDNLIRPNLESTTQNKRSVVLKVRRKKVIKNGKCISFSIIGFEIAGLIKKTVVFTNPADFQFLPTFEKASAYSKPLQQSCPNGSLPLEIVPQSISRIDFEKRVQFISFLHIPKRTKKTNAQPSRKVSSELNHEDLERKESDIEHADEKPKNSNNSSDEGEGSHKRSVKKRNPDSGHTQILKFGDAIPFSHPLGMYPPRWIVKRNQTGEEFRGLGFIDRLKELFEKIPVLKRSQIIDFLGIGSRQHLFKECLPYVAYTYSNGPFSNLWIRYGYDPTAHASSRIFQLLNCRFLPQYLINLSDKLTDYIGRDKIHRKMVDLDRMEIVDAPEEFSHRFIDKGAFARLPISIFGYICKHQVSFQVHALSDKQLFNFVQQMQVTNVCSEQTGWFTDEAAAVFRNFVTKFLEQRIETFLHSPVVFATKPTVPFVVAKSEDQTLVASRLQQFLQDYDTFSAFEDTWFAAQEQYPVSSHRAASASSDESFPEENQNRKTIFWLLKYSAAAEKNADILDRVLLPSFQPAGSQEWSSTKRKSSGWHEAHDKIRDKNALLAAAVATANTSATVAASQSQPFTSPLFAASATAGSKRNVRFAPTTEQNLPQHQLLSTNNASSAVFEPPALQFTLNSDAIANSSGFAMLDSDSGDEY